MKNIIYFSNQEIGVEVCVDVAINDFGDGKEIRLIGEVKSQEIFNWSASWVPKNFFGDGHIEIGADGINISNENLRGKGIGSAVMSFIICFLKENCEGLTVNSILLSAEDAQDENSKKIRNKFYEKFGFKFDYKDNETWGKSEEIKIEELNCNNFGKWDLRCEE